RGSVEGALVGGLLRRDACGNRLGALEAGRRIEMSALGARVQRFAALAALRRRADRIEIEDALAAMLAAEDDGLVLIDAPAPRAFARRTRPGRPPAGRLRTGVHVAAVPILTVVAQRPIPSGL